MKSIAGSLAWICRQCRPDLSYRVSRIQSASNHGTVPTSGKPTRPLSVLFALMIVDSYSVQVCWTGRDWKKPGALVNLVIADASHANESEDMIIKEMTFVDRGRQGAPMVFLATEDLQTKVTFILSLGTSSNLVRRACRSTVQAEAYTL